MWGKKGEGSQRWRGKPREEKEAGAGRQSLSLRCSSRRFWPRQSCPCKEPCAPHRVGLPCSPVFGLEQRAQWWVESTETGRLSVTRPIAKRGEVHFCGLQSGSVLLNLFGCRLPLKNILRDGCSGKLSRNRLIGTKPQTMSSVGPCD